MRVKISLCAMFAGGIFVTVLGFLRCVLIFTVGFQFFHPIKLFVQCDSECLLIVLLGLRTSTIEAGQWSCRESFSAVLVRNLPLLYPFLSRWLHQVQLISFGTQQKSSGSIRLNTFGSGGKKSREKETGPYSIPGTTVLESTVWDRTIVGEQSWHSRERIYIPTHKVDIEAGKDRDTQKRSGVEKLGTDITVLTEVGVRFSDKKRGIT
jgi:hypothetical protein